MRERATEGVSERVTEGVSDSSTQQLLTGELVLPVRNTRALALFMLKCLR